MEDLVFGNAVHEQRGIGVRRKARQRRGVHGDFNRSRAVGTARRANANCGTRIIPSLRMGMGSLSQGDEAQEERE